MYIAWSKKWQIYDDKSWHTSSEHQKAMGGVHAFLAATSTRSTLMFP